MSTPRLASRHATPRATFGRRSGWRRATVLVSTLLIVTFVFVVLSLATARSGGPDDPLPAVVIGVASLSFATVGAILVSRLPRNLIGWLLAAGGLCFAVDNGATGLADYGLISHPGSLPGAIWFAWLSQWIWAPAIGTVFGLALVYPPGRLLSPRWRPVAFTGALIIGLISFGAATGPWPRGMFPVPNPLLIAGGGPATLDVVSPIATLIAVLVAVLSIGSLVIRFRRAAAVERAQLKWFAAMVAVSVPAFLVGVALYGNSGVAAIVANVADGIAFGGFALLPVAIGIAILRYRLYEIDRLISRGIGWGVLTVILGAAFVGLVLGLQTLLAPFTGSNELAVAGSTLLVFSLFQPIRRRVQAVVDRRFNRARYDAEEAVAAFTERLRDEVDLDTLQGSLLTIVEATLEPTTSRLWLRE
jgi:hypothetical protein